MAKSTKSLFAATKKKVDKGDPLPMGLPKVKIEAVRDPLDYDPTPSDATLSVLRREIGHIRKHGNLISEPAVGAGHIAYVLREHGFEVRAGDIIDRNYRGIVCLGSYYDTREAPAPIHFTNPPYNEVSSRDGHGRWLRHALELGGGYIALLLGAEWPFARANGFDELFRLHPPSIEYKCCWKIDFRGQGRPAHRNSWFIWDTNRPALGPNTWITERLYREQPDPDQGAFDGM